MKTKNKIISIFMCLCLAVLSGCSQDGGGEPASGANSAATSAAGNAGGSSNTANTEGNVGNAGSDSAVTEGNAADTEDSGAEVTEAEQQPVDDRFAYYDLLSEEYNRSGKLYSLGFGGGVYVINGKVAHFNLLLGKVRIYDCETKSDIMNIQFDNFDYGKFVQWNEQQCLYADVDGGYIYRTPYLGYSGTYYKYDNSGNLIGQIDTEEMLELLLADGTFITYSGYGDNRKYYLYSEDWKTKTELPAPQYDAGHGIMETISEYNVATKYKNKIYVYTPHYRANNPKENEGCYCLNTDTGTWEHIDSYLQNVSFEANSRSLYNTVGRYFIIEGAPGMIYDMETDTVIANIAQGADFGENYQGGKSTLQLYSNGQLRKIRYPSDGSEAEVEIILESEELILDSFETGQYAVNEEYYLFLDKYGAFLRTYKDGENGEITVILYENQ